MHALPQIRQQMQPGRSSKKVLPGADVMIAAVAISLNAVVVTHNVVDYLSVHEHFTLPGLYDPIADVWHAEPYRSEEHTSELQSLMRSSYAVFCLTKKKVQKNSNQSQLYKVKYNLI